MRLDARRGDTGWWVWNVERCQPELNTVFVDDEQLTWGTLRQPLQVGEDGRVVLDVHQAKRIDIYPNRRLVLINAVEDDEQSETDVCTVVQRHWGAV